MILFDTFKSKLNNRQLKKMLTEIIDGFHGGITAKKHIDSNKTSKSITPYDLQFIRNSRCKLLVNSLTPLIIINFKKINY